MENARLERMYAELSLENDMLRNRNLKKLYARWSIERRLLTV